VRNILIVLWCVFTTSLFGVTLQGKLVDRTTMRPIKNGTVILRVSNLPPQIAYSDEEGIFVFDEAPEGRLTIEAKVIGYYTETTTITVTKPTSLSLYLTPLPSASGGEIEVTAERERAVPKTSVSRTDIQKSLQSITSDPVEALKKMPGIDTPLNDSTTGAKLLVRGGEGFETYADLDGLFLTSFFHRGVIADSFFLQDMVEEMVLYKGVAPVEYGQILSGFLSVRQIDPPAGFHGKLDTGLLATSLTLYSKTADGKWQWAGGFRRTYYDLILPLFFQTTSDKQNIGIPYYFDAHGKLAYTSDADTVRLVYLFSYEPGYFTNLQPEISIKGGFTYLTTGIGLDWTHRFSSHMLLEQSINIRTDDHTTSLDVSTNIQTRWEDHELFLRYRIVPKILFSEDLSLIGGLETMVSPILSYSNITRGTYFNTITLQQDYTNFAETVASTNTSLFAGFARIEWSLLEKKLFLAPGVRVSYFPVVHNYSIDPRLNTEWQISKEHTLFAGIGYLSAWPIEPTIFSFYTTNEHKRSIPGVWHGVLGWKSQPTDLWEISTELYGKHYVTMTTRASNVQIEYQSGGEKKEVAGIELLVRKLRGGFPLYGWLSMSFMNEWHFREEALDPNSFYGISTTIDNQGNLTSSLGVIGQTAPVPLKEWISLPSYKANLTAIWDFARHWSLTAEFQYESRGFITPIEGANQTVVGTNIVYTPRYGKFLSEKMPDHHQLNLKLEWTPTWFGLPWGIYVQVVNIYNYRDISYTYTDDYSSRITNRSPLGIYGHGGIWVKW